MNWANNLWTRLSPFGFVVFAGVVVVEVALMFLPLLHQHRVMNHELQQLDQEITRQDALERHQQMEIEALKTDPLFVERVARDKLNLARPNETIFRFEPVPTARPR